MCQYIQELLQEIDHRINDLQYSQSHDLIHLTFSTQCNKYFTQNKSLCVPVLVSVNTRTSLSTL